jgi:trans-aconitate methyltransferase
MNDRDAADLLRPAVSPSPRARWADLGAGTGTFTRALATLLGPDAEIHAVDADARALRTLRDAAERTAAPPIHVHHADFTRRLPLPPLDGILLANALHFVREQPAMVALAASYLRPGGRLVIIEYEDRPASRWVPHPVPFTRFAELAADAGLTPPRTVGRRPSAYGGEMYVALAVASTGM